MTYINRLKAWHIVEMIWIFFIINRKTWIDCMKELQVSETISVK